MDGKTVPPADRSVALSLANW